MSEKTNEELADWLVSMANTKAYVPADDVMLKEAAARLRQQPEAIEYPTAKRAIKLFEGEYIGQSVPELWAWAVKQAIKS